MKKLVAPQLIMALLIMLPFGLLAKIPFDLFSIIFVYKYPHHTKKIQRSDKTLCPFPNSSVYLKLIRLRPRDPMSPFRWKACVKNADGDVNISYFIFSIDTVKKEKRKNGLVIEEQDIYTYQLKNTIFESGILRSWFVYSLGLCSNSKPVVKETTIIQKTPPVYTLIAPYGLTIEYLDDNFG